MPRIDENLARLGKAKIYTIIDLAWAFWQIPVRKADRQKTAFACDLGLFEWRGMPFGMCNASATFQRAITRALRDIVNRESSMVMAYIDDIVIATETVEDHMIRLREVFNCLREAGFKMRVAKCDFMKSEIKYLGRVVSAEGIKPDSKAVAKLRHWEVPRNKTEMQSEFIPWHAKLVAPLHAITGLNATFAWGSEQQLAFNETKKRSSMPPRWRNRISKANLYWIPMLVLSPSLASSTSGEAHLESDVYVQYSMVARSSPLRKPNTERLNWKCTLLITSL